MMATLSLYYHLISVRVRSQMQYRASFALDMLSTFLGNMVYFATFAAVVTRFGDIRGWTLGEVAFLFAMAEFSFAFMDLIFSGYDYDFFSQVIRRGHFDQMLVRPLALPLQVLTSEFALRRLGRMAEGVFIFAVSMRLAHVDWTLAKVLYLPVVVMSIVAFFAGLYIIGSTVCFWTIERLEVFNLFTYGGAEMLSYPMHIYNDWLRRFFTFIVPAALVSYYPALYILGKPDPLGMPRLLSFVAPLAGGGTLAAAFAFWRIGVRHYQGTGT
ncbi:MAG: ABC transporter permease [Anaerolineae bacterium]